MSAHRRIPALDGQRAIACLAVIAGHLGLPLCGGGWLGVDVFFVLSGFLITGIVLKERELTGTIRLRAFYLRRAGRLYPALLLTIAIHLLLSPSLMSWRDVLVSAGMAGTYLMNFWPFVTFGHEPSLIWHTWSLAIEEHFYLLWPPAVLALGSRRRVVRWALVLGAASVTAMALTRGTVPGLTLGYFMSWTRAWELLAGCALAAAAPAVGRRTAAWAGWAGAGALLTAFGAGNWVDRTSAPAMTGVIVMAVLGSVLLIVAARDGRGLVPRTLSIRPLRWVGDHSYGLYLYHPFVTYLVERLMPSRELVTAPVVLLGVCLVAWASRRWVEEPVRQAAVRRTAPPPDPRRPLPRQNLRSAA
jgi:peptidoglycan/LPS O-acetylase OafA/YrhL